MLQTGRRHSTELFADDVAAFMQAVGIPNAHISGLSLGAASGVWLAAKYPNRVKLLGFKRKLKLHVANPEAIGAILGGRL